MELTVLIENTARSGLAYEHGLSVYINYKGHELLLDGGSSGAFLRNAEVLGVDITKIELAALSHGHYDHGDGLAAFLEVNRTAPVWLRPKALEPQELDGEQVGLSPRAGAALRDRGRFVEGPTEVLPGVWLVPDRVDHEQSLALEGDEGLVVLNSCCHAGAGYIVRDLKKRFPGKPVAALIGGLHLMGLGGPDTLGVAPGIVRNLGKWLFEELEVGALYTGHCTGDPALALLREDYPERVRRLTGGLKIQA